MENNAINDLLVPMLPKRILLELTLRCNLKCAYCESILPEYKTPRIDKDPADLDAIIDYLIDHKPEGVCVSGYGETTIYKNWHRYCNRLLDSGISLTMITNLAKEYSSGELETLSRFTVLQVSCDTADPELFKKLRCGNTLERFLGNMEKIRATARKAGRTPPLFTWSCVVCDKTVFGLIDYVRFGLQCEVKSFYMCNYATFLDVNKRLEPKRITEMASDKFLKAVKIIYELQERLQKAGMEFLIVPGLVDAINDKLQALALSVEHCLPAEDLGSIFGDAQPEESAESNTVQTRFCSEPWYNCFIRADNEVRPCCTFDTENKLGPGHTLTEVYNSESMVDLRRSLLLGELKPKCLVCPHAGLGSVNDFRQALRKRLGLPQPAGQLEPAAVVVPREPAAAMV